MASKKRTGKKKSAKGRKKPRTEDQDRRPFSIKFYGADEVRRLKNSAHAADLSLSAWARRVLDAVVEDLDDCPSEPLADFQQKSIALTESDRARVARGTAIAHVTGQAAWLRYVLLAAASEPDESELLKQLRRAREVGNKIRSKSED